MGCTHASRSLYTAYGRAMARSFEREEWALEDAAGGDASGARKWLRGAQWWRGLAHRYLAAAGTI